VWEVLTDYLGAWEYVVEDGVDDCLCGKVCDCWDLLESERARE